MEDINSERVAATVRTMAEARGVTRADLRRALGITDRRTINSRWDGDKAWNLTELAIVADTLGVRLADLLIQHDE